MNLVSFSLQPSFDSGSQRLASTLSPLILMISILNTSTESPGILGGEPDAPEKHGRLARGHIGVPEHRLAHIHGAALR